MTMSTTFTIDCQTCPVRGRMCGDCFVPVLGRTWLQPPSGEPPRHPGDGLPVDACPPERPADEHLAPLDTDELAAVSAFVRAGLVDPEEASRARAEVVAGVRSAAG